MPPAVRPVSASSSSVDDPASEVYVRHKVKDGTDVGNVRRSRPPSGESATLEETLAVVSGLNESPIHDGIIVQSPLPSAMGSSAELRVFETIDPSKDVDGFSPVNVGRLVQNRAVLRSCTPAGIMELLARSERRGRRAASRRHRPQRHRGQADGADAPARACDGDGLSFADREPRRSGGDGRRARRCDRTGGPGDAGVGQTGCRWWSMSG